MLWDFPGDLVFKTPHFHSRGHRFNPWSGTYDPTCLRVWQKKKKKKGIMCLTTYVTLDLIKFLFFISRIQLAKFMSQASNGMLAELYRQMV